MAEAEEFVLTSITDEHLIPLEILCERLETNLKSGITDKTATRLLQENGKNKFISPKRKISKELNFFNTNNGKKDMENFTKTEWKKLFGQCIPEETTVVRNGIKKTVYGKHVVIGDLTVLQAGDLVPADIRIIHSETLTVDNRLITSNKCEMRTHLNEYVNQDCLLSSNMVYACTRILTGVCVGIVLRTGEKTVFGTLKNHATKVEYLSASRRKKKSSVESNDTYF